MAFSLEGVLHLWDDRAGSLAELAIRSSMPLRICVHGPSGGAWSGLADLRVLLVADVLARIAELQGFQVTVVLAAAGPPPAGLDHDVSALGIYPPAACTGPGDAETALGGPAHVHLARSAAGFSDTAGGLLLGVGAVEDLTHGEAGRDSLALRLALSSRSYRQPLQLTLDVLAEAAGSLDRWRAGVAKWAGEPSRPIPAEVAAKIRDAFDEDLDTVAALDLLRSVESSQEMPAGAKFETFVFMDRVLGLELAREVGRG